jgi:superfamily II DNA helicase RecQ
VIYTDDAARDFDRYDMEQERKRARLPVCDNRKCRRQIDDEYFYEIDGDYLCEKCMILRYRRNVEDFIEI